MPSFGASEFEIGCSYCFHIPKRILSGNDSKAAFAVERPSEQAPQKRKTPLSELQGVYIYSIVDDKAEGTALPCPSVVGTDAKIVLVSSAALRATVPTL